VFAGSSPITFTSPSSKARQKSGSFPLPALPGFIGRMTLSDSRQCRRLKATLRPLPSHRTGLPRLPEPPFRRAVPTTPADRAGAHVDYFPAHAAFPTYPGGSASALSLSRPAQALLALRPAESLSRPQATFVTRLRPFRLPGRAARQLPDQSTTFRMESSSTDGSGRTGHDGQKSSGSRDVIRPRRGRSPHAPAEAATAAVRRMAVMPMHGYEPDVLIFSAGFGGEQW
jgi:hypothetical protein